MKTPRRYNITPRIGPVFIEAGYFGGMYYNGDPLIEASLFQRVDGYGANYLVLFSFRIWRLVLSVSVDFKKEVEECVIA